MKSTKILTILVVAVMSVSLLARVERPDDAPKGKGWDQVWDALISLQDQIDQGSAGLRTALNQEIADRIADVDAEESARQAADQVLQSNIDAEATVRSNADTALQTALDQEIADRVADVDAEEAARIAADSALQAQIDAIPLLPGGVIVMWSGTISDIPDGWVLCDGSGGTPDLSDRFIRGASGGDIGDIGGCETHSHSYSDLPQHTHTAACDADGEHKHKVLISTHGVKTNTSTTGTPIMKGPPDLFDSEPAGSHSHGITINNTGNASCSTEEANVLPPYYKLAFIMKL